MNCSQAIGPCLRCNSLTGATSCQEPLFNASTLQCVEAGHSSRTSLGSGIPRRMRRTLQGHEPSAGVHQKGRDLRGRRPQERLGRRLEEVAKAVGGGYCRLPMPLETALAVHGDSGCKLYARKQPLCVESGR